MDYSTSINDAENPAGASPWGSSPVLSPQHAPTSAFPTSRDAPLSPAPYSPNGFEDTIGGGGFQRPDGIAETESAAESDGRRPDTADSNPPPEQQPFLGNQPQAPSQQQHQGQPPRPEPQRYHQSARQTQQQTQAPQYKLQAKITGLERTGRKDPILRFDVHVRLISATPFTLERN